MAGIGDPRRRTERNPVDLRSFPSVPIDVSLAFFVAQLIMRLPWVGEWFQHVCWHVWSFNDDSGYEFLSFKDDKVLSWFPINSGI